ncbi:MAG: hypothetical protein AAF624_00175 [Bacteroidota bacterium]
MPDPTQGAPGTSHPFRAPVWVLLSGVLLGLSFPPTGLYPLAWVALVPLVVRWAHSPSPWLSFGDAYAAFLAMSVVGGYWSLLHQEPDQALRAGLLLLTLPAAMGVPFVVGWYLRDRLGNALAFAALAALALIVETLVGGWVVPLPWAQIGHTQLASLTLIQVADVSGISGVSAWLWLLGGLGAWAVSSSHYLRPILANRTVALLTLALVFILPFLYGSYRLESAGAELRSLNVGVIQPAQPPKQWLHSDPAARIDQLASLSASLLENSAYLPAADSLASAKKRHLIDLVVWPELSLPVYSDAARTNRLYRRVNAWAESHGVALLAGAATQPAGMPPAPATGRFNSALLFTPPRLSSGAIRSVPTSSSTGHALWSRRWRSPSCKRTGASPRLSGPSRPRLPKSHFGWTASKLGRCWASSRCSPKKPGASCSAGPTCSSCSRRTIGGARGPPRTCISPWHGYAPWRRAGPLYSRP